MSTSPLTTPTASNPSPSRRPANLLRQARTGLFGWDVFISYRRADASAYARELRDQLEARGFTVFLDDEDLHVGIPARVYARRVRRSRMLVLVGTPGIFESQHVPVELHQYQRRWWLTHLWRRVFPINVGHALDAFEDRASAAHHPPPWKFLAGRLSVAETSDAVKAGAPSPSVVERITVSYAGVRSSFLFLASVVFALIAVAGATTYSAATIGSARAQVAALQVTRDSLDERVLAAQEALDQTSAQLADTAAALADTRTGLATTRHQLAGTVLELDRTSTELRTTAADLARSNQDLIHTRAEAQAEQRRADSARAEVRAALLASSALGAITDDPTLAVRLALASRGIRPSPVADEVLMRAYNSDEVFYSHLFRDVRDADLSPDGETALTIGFRERGARLVELRSGAAAPLALGSFDTVAGGRFVDGGRGVLTWTTRGRLERWNRSGEPVASLETGLRFGGGGVSVEVCPSGTLALAATDDTAHVWDLRTDGHRTITLREPGAARAGGFLFEGRVVVLRCAPGGGRFLVRRDMAPGVEIWDMEGKKVATLVPAGLSEGELYLGRVDARFSPDGQWIAAVRDNRLSLWRDGREVRFTSTDSTFFDTFEFSPDSRHLHLTTTDGAAETLILGEAADSAEVVRVPLPPFLRATDAAAFSQDGSRLALANREGVVTIYDRAARPLLFLRGHETGDTNNGSVERVVWSSGDSTMLTVGHDLTARVWRLGSARWRTLGDSAGVHYLDHSLVHSPDRERVGVVAWRDPHLTVDVFRHDGRLLRTLGGHEDMVHIVFPTDTGLVLTRSEDRIQFWRASEPPVVILPDSGAPFAGSAAISPDGQSIVYWESGVRGMGIRRALAWTLLGAPLPPDSAVVRQLQAAAAPADPPQSFAGEGYCHGLEWQRRGRAWGASVRYPDTPRRFWIPARLPRLGDSQRSFPYGCDAASRYAHALIYGSRNRAQEMEFMLLDPDLIARRLTSDGGVWELDAEARRNHAVGQGAEAPNH